ncbi:MAG: SprB repeat-containing protein, partial [Flavobacteriales bacterium]|nr:SprB repeat-containing protein [Flavobacteriales bacterium]
MLRRQLYLILYIALLLLSCDFDVYAGHRPGGWYTWECIGPNTYVITFTRIANCNKNLEKDASYCLTGSLGGNPNNGTYNVDSAYSVAHPTAFCSGAKICDKNGYNWPYEVVYIDTIVLTPFSPSYTIAYCDGGGRPKADNGSGGFYVEASFDTVAPCNSSAYSTTFPDRFYCPGDTSCIDNNFVDPDGDSLVFYLGNCYNFTYNGGFTGADPMTSTIGWLIDSAGNICFLPPAIQSGYVCLVIEEWRNGVKIAESIKEILIDVIDCSVLYNSPTVPSFPVDLTGNPDSNWISLDTAREGTVCGAPCTDDCIEFIVTLDPGAEAIIFDVYSGAVPPGALFYQIDCGSPVPVGDPICLTGTGPFSITFCKPGGNTNEYTIISIPKPSASTDIAVNDGCAGTLFAYGYDVSTISWTSVFPGSIGDYNSYLSCLFTCDSTVATGDVLAPPFVDYQVCGGPLGGCDTLLVVCDTMRVYFNTELFANILPIIPTICFGDTSVTLTANGIGGTPPYSWLWSTGDTAESVNVNTGTYWVMVTDTSYPSCPPTFDTVVVTSFTSTITANAGTDQTVCINSDSVQLSGVVTAANGGVWSGGNGTFIPAADSLNTIYIPDSVEIAGGSVILILTTTGNGSCPPDADSVVIAIINIDSISTTGTNLACNSICNGNAAATLYGGSLPYTYQWNDPASQTAQTATGLCADTFNVTVTESNGCSATTSIIITEPLPFTYTLEVDDSLECDDDCDGEVDLDDVTGGTSPYTFSWSPPGFTIDLDDDGDGVEYEDICIGDVYIVTTTDANGCSFTDSIELIEPNAVVPAIVSITDATCNGLCDGQATVSVSGGTPSYDFNWSPTGGNSATATGLCFGIYTVFIEDDNDCDTTLTITITEPTILSGSITTISNTSCNGGNDGEATVAPSGGTPSYTYLWNDTANQTTATATGLSAGTYTVTVTDSSGCTTTVDAIINEPVILTADITDSTNVTCNGSDDGTATVTASGGTPLYTYLWGTSPVQTTALATGLTVGTYTITVTDARGCNITANVTIDEPSPLIATITSATDVSCFGGADGDATATAINGTSPYTYSWSTNPVQTNATATGLSTGIYMVTITDDNGCNSTANVIINNPSPLALNISIITLPSNCGASDGEACVTAMGGIPPYSYFWNTAPVQNTACATSLPTGSVNVIVSDSNGCASVGTAVIGDLNVVITVDSVNDVTCYGGNNGQAWITVSGATPPYTYLWDDPNSQTTPTATGLTAGTYSINVTDPNNCWSALSITVNQPLPIIDNIATTNLACFGDQSGQASVTTSGEYPPYTYSWNTSPVQTLATATGLSASNYTLTVTDAIGCDTSISVNISQPDLLTANISSTNISCTGANDASAAVTTTGGVTPYSYLWNPGGQTTAVVNNLQPVSYTVTVADANGCDTSTTVTITEPNILTVNLTSTDVSCNGFCDGQATANISGGTPGYTYFWTTTPFQSNAAATGLCPGNYTVTVLDFNGCDTTANTTITEPPLLTASITTVNHVTCNSGNDGAATVTPSGGTLPYTYSWSDPSSQTDSTANSLYAGTYTVTVTDANGCSVLNTVTIAEPTLLTANISGSTNVSCNGAGDGQATVSGLGGTPAYTYSWSTTPVQSTATADSLFPGNYTVTVTDFNGCNIVASVSISEPAILTAVITDSVNMSCFGVNDGSITVAVSGGTTPYYYLWSDLSAQSTATASGLSAGTYVVVVTDANGCDSLASAAIIEPPLLTHSITSVVDVGCNGACDGAASVAASGGTPGYTYVWNTTPFQSNATATGLCPGAYTITVADTNGCITVQSIAVVDPPVLTSSLDPVVTHVSCKGGSDGAATAVALGGSIPYSYLRNDLATQTTATATGLSAGTYTAVVTDSNNCGSTGNVTVTINEPTQSLAISIIDTLDVSCNGGSDGEA